MAVYFQIVPTNASRGQPCSSPSAVLHIARLLYLLHTSALRQRQLRRECRDAQWQDLQRSFVHLCYLESWNSTEIWNCNKVCMELHESENSLKSRNSRKSEDIRKVKTWHEVETWCKVEIWRKFGTRNKVKTWL